MKNTSLLLLCMLFVISLNAQWSDKTNYFTDSNHMPVSTTMGDQVNALSIRSYPDSGYIIFWEDSRNTANTSTDIYAQKFDKNGKRLWAVNGVPVSTGPNRQHFYPATNSDSRNYSYAATDSANGFYITYIDDSSNQYSWPRIVVQHITSIGSRVFGNTGYIIAESKGNGYNYDAPQLIADGNKGFYIGYKRLANGYMDVQVYCYKEQSGKLKVVGGGQMDYNVYLTQIGSCSNYTLAYRDAYASDFAIYPDLQKGCNVVMSLSESGLGNNPAYIGFNRLIRVKKNTTTHLYGDNTAFTYKKDSVVAYYRPFWHTYTWYCGDGTTGTGYVLESNGFQKVGNYAYQIEKSQGITLSTSGNINADIITSNIRLYTSDVTAWYTQRFINRSEQFDDMPYEFKVAPYTPRTLGNTIKPGLNKINGGTDTLLSNGDTYYYNYCVKGGGSSMYATALCRNAAGSHYDVLLQNMKLFKKATDSFAVEYTTGRESGIIIGRDTATGFSSANITYYNPQVVVDNNGNGVFYIRDYGSFPRVSPIINGAQLAWGAMGRTAGTGMYRGSYYYPDAPFMTIDPTNGTGIMSWQDGRNYDGYNNNNIMMRHIDKLTTFNYMPPYKPVESPGFGGADTWPLALLGTSKKFTLLEMWNPYSGMASPALEVQDNVNLGVMYVNVYHNTSTSIRIYNGQAYLDRDLNVRTEKNVAAGTKITVRFFFTTADFNVLKAADAGVHTPADLMIVRQPSTANNAPNAYSPTGNEKTISVQSYKAVNNGYYIQAGITGFVGNNNFFVFPAGASTALQAAPFAASKTTTDHSFIKQLYPTLLTNGNLFIATGNAPVTNMLVEIFAADGKRLFIHQLPYTSQTIDLPAMANGEYRVKITSGTYRFEQAVVYNK